MTAAQIYAALRAALAAALAEEGLDGAVSVSARGLTPAEAIGRPGRTDYPILSGKEVMLMADVQGGKGQAFTDAPVAFHGSLREVLELDLEGDPHSRGLFVAVLNAVMARLGRADNTVHCRDGGPEFCARHMADWVAEAYGTPKIALVGYQPALIGALSQHFPLRVLDLNPEHIGTVKDGCPVLDGKADRQAVIDWADLVLCTGSTLCNGTIVDYLELEKEVVFFGTSLSGAAPILGLKRMCFADESLAAESGQ